MTAVIPSISHVEWLVTDLTRSVAFLQGLFGWEFTVYSRHYRLYTPAQGTAVGLLEVAQVVPSQATLVHVQVQNLAQSLQTAVTLGAKIATPPTVVPGHGRYAQVTDPDGNLIGLFEADPTV